MRKPSIICANRTGGQGKTLTSQIIEFGYSLNDQKLTVISADATKDSESKLAGLLGDVVEIGIGAGIADVRANQHVALQHWDRLGTYLLNGSCIVDVGANVLPSILEWARERGASRLLKGRDLVLVVPITTQKQSITDAKEILQSSFDDPSLPFTERYVVLNQYHGQFGDIRKLDEMQPIRDLERRGVRLVNLARANVEIWEQFELRSFSLRRLARMSNTDFEREFRLDPFAACGVEMEFKTWVKGAVDEFHKAGIVPVSHPELIDLISSASSDGKESATHPA